VPNGTWASPAPRCRAVDIRPAGPADLPEVLRLVALLHPEDAPPDPDPAARALTEILSRGDDHALLVAETGGAIVGTLHLVISPNLTHDGAPWAIVENVVVDEARRASGVGRALMEEAERRARDAGCYKVQLMSADQRGVGAFYETLGFEPRARGYRKYF
jgi:GNAT superfamily N-acetyltransferase